MTTVAQIIDHLEGRLIPMEVNLDGEVPPGYEDKLEKAYQKNMRRRAHRLLQMIAPSKRESILLFLENEESIRQANQHLDSLGYNERALQEMNQMARDLIKSKEKIVNHTHQQILDEHELMSVFVGGSSEARVSTGNE